MIILFKKIFSKIYIMVQHLIKNFYLCYQKNIILKNKKIQFKLEDSDKELAVCYRKR